MLKIIGTLSVVQFIACGARIYREFMCKEGVAIILNCSGDASL